MNSYDDLVFIKKGEIVITQEQIPKFKEVVNNISKPDKPPLPAPPNPTVVSDGNYGLIGIGMGACVAVIITAMILMKFI